MNKKIQIITKALLDSAEEVLQRRAGNDTEGGAESELLPLKSIFNRLNGNIENCSHRMNSKSDILADCSYKPTTKAPGPEINYPVKGSANFTHGQYAEIESLIAEAGKKLNDSLESVNEFIDVLEETLTYVPSTVENGEASDISLFSSIKLKAAFLSCIYEYFEEHGIQDFDSELSQQNAEDFADKYGGEKMFVLCSLDIPKKQDFVYTIASKNALKTLRARSFYLELLMRCMVEDLLCKLELSKANLIYAGGGHCYILLPNTERAKRITDRFLADTRAWMLENFDEKLYVAYGAVSCSLNALLHSEDKSYSAIFDSIAKQVAANKNHRYNAADIIRLNNKPSDDNSIECAKCKSMKKVREYKGEFLCPICHSMELLSDSILKAEYFVETLNETEGSLPLPDGNFLSPIDPEKNGHTEDEAQVVKYYSKNKPCGKRRGSSGMWVADYASEKEDENRRGFKTFKTFKDLGNAATGIERIAVLRADVDYLGQMFTNGFDDKSNSNKYVSLVRTANLSSQLALFFQYHLNEILAHAEDVQLGGVKGQPRNVTVCYSGGDDMFLVGAWNDVLGAAIDIANCFNKYTQGRLSFSAGYGIYQAGYPIKAIADEVAELEDASKKLPEKSAITLFSDNKSSHQEKSKKQGSPNAAIKVDDGTYHWTEFQNEVLGEKLAALREFFDNSDERGKAFLYNILDLIREGVTEPEKVTEENGVQREIKHKKMSFARLVYLFSRLEPQDNADKEQKDRFNAFREKMFGWIQNPKDCRQLKTAMILYVYTIRTREE